MSKIGIYGGSFDPIHLGHIQIALRAYEALNLDKVLLIPNVVSPFMKETGVDYQSRYEMVEIAIQAYPFLEVSDIESKLPNPSYTLNSLKALIEGKTNKEEVDEYYLIVGGDQAALLDKWYKIDELLILCQLVVVARDSEMITCKYPYLKLEMALISASSSDVRKGNFKLLSPGVKNYVIQHELYLDNIVKSKMSKQRYLHSKSVQKLAIDLAKRYDLDVSIASLAGLLHDICKEASAEEYAYFMAFESEEHQQMHKKILHQFVGARFVKDCLCIDNVDVYEAIYHHVIGDSDNPYAKVLFIADKCEETRNYDSSEILARCYKDLNEGFDYCLKKNLEYLNKEKN